MLLRQDGWLGYVHVTPMALFANFTAYPPAPKDTTADAHASLVRQINDLRDVISQQQVRIDALQALNTGTPDSARAEADATILAWGPRFRAALSWELETEADAQIAYEAWEQLVLQMATAKHAAEVVPVSTPGGES